jgi:hypothetical protein
MTNAEELAGELEAATDTIHTEVAAIADDCWSNAITGPLGWLIGHTAHHIDEGYLQSPSRIEQAVVDARLIVLDPALLGCEPSTAPTRDVLRSTRTSSAPRPLSASSP